jgi:hypothetical protein
MEWKRKQVIRPSIKRALEMGLILEKKPQVYSRASS